MITIGIRGGLGNQLFQLAALDSIANQTNRTEYLEVDKTPPTHHSDQDYFKTIFSKWDTIPRHTLSARSYDFTISGYRYTQFSFEEPNVRLEGYFQNYQYIRDEFLEKLHFPAVPTLDGAFLHIRGGDYRIPGKEIHQVPLENYYRNAIKLFPVGTCFYIFTNEKSYASLQPFLRDIPYVFVSEDNEVRALALMKNCTRGGICANSTFSWWGAYLNRENRTLVLPSKMFQGIPDLYEGGYYFPGCTIVGV
jgi:hypothetical protein